MRPARPQSSIGATTARWRGGGSESRRSRAGATRSTATRTSPPRAPPGRPTSLSLARDLFLRRPRAEREIQLLVAQHLAAAEDLRDVVLEEQVGELVERDLELLAEPHHLDEVGRGPHQPR